MHFLKMDAVLLLQLVLFAVGVGWVITGSKIGRFVRVGFHFAFGWFPGRYLNSLAFCPPCCTWWCGAALALVSGLSVLNTFQVAFTASFLMAICNAQWQLDAGDKEEIEKLLWTEHDERPEEQKE